MLSQFRPKALTTPSRSHLFSSTVISSALRALWVVLVISGELGAFFWSLSGCRWPSVEVPRNMRKNVKPARVLLIADTQIHHPAILADGSLWANPIRRVLFELNMRKNWHVTSRLKPDAVIFLGDMLANAKVSRSLEEYTRVVQKFKSIFEPESDMEMYYIPGNNDVGLGSLSSNSKQLRSYFTKTFGPLNQQFVIANHTFLALDAPALVDEDYQRHAKHVSFDDWKPIPDGAIAFVKDVAQSGPGHVILLSHIPLARSETADCGPHREKGSIRRGAGNGYQSMLGKQTTSFLLQTLKPIVVFSGDNRDYCDYVHSVPGTREESHNPDNSVKEITVKSFSMSVDIQRPGFQLLSLVDPAKVATPESPTYADAPCLLPDQFRIYTSFYLPCFLITLFVLFILNLKKGKPRPLRKIDSLGHSPGSGGHNTPSPLVSGDAAPWSAAWTSFSPVIPVSPRTPLPSYLRTPRISTGSATHLVASLPGTPAPSSPTKYLSPMPYSGEDDGEEDDTMYPAQYAMRRESMAQRDDDEWSQVGQSHGKDEDYEIVYDQESAISNLAASPRHHSEFISAPVRAKASVAPKKSRWSWSYTFTLRGRRRTVTLRSPSMTSVRNLFELIGLSGEPASLGARRRRGGPTGMTVDALSVFWPATVVWAIINWTIL